MCSNYRPSSREQLQQHFGVAPPDSDYKAECYPGYMAPIIRLPRPDAMPGDRACAIGMFGMVPHWADAKLARHTYNARTETVASKPSFRNAYKHRQFCVIPVASFYEPSYETGKAERWEIADAEGHPLMQRFHKPEDEKRMLVILRPEQYDEWLTCPVEDAPKLLEPYPAGRLVAHAAPRTDAGPRQQTLLDI